MGNIIFDCIKKKGSDKLESQFSSVFDIPCKELLAWDEQPLSSVKGNNKAFLFVNVATKWGLTDKNYTQLVQMHSELNSKGFEILGFPCN